MSGPDLDVFGISIGRLFRFGGLTFNMSSDTDRNLSLGLTYNISIGKIPGQNKLFTNAENQIMNYGTIYARAVDEAGAPVPNAAVFVTGREAPIRTDANGEVLITNIEPYQKAIMSVDEQDVSDFALVPEWNTKKLVLRLGVVRPVEIPFSRLGGIEGYMSASDNGRKYTIYIKDFDGTIVAVKRTDSDGAFIFDGIKYGTYLLEAINSSGQTVAQRQVTIDRSFQTMRTPLDAK